MSSSASSIPLRRQRTLSLESLSSLSTVPSSPASSVVVERALEPSSSTMSAHVTLPQSRPPKKKRKTEPLPSTSETVSDKKKGKRRQSDMSTIAPQPTEDEVRHWEVVQGYNGPCDWPDAMPDGSSSRNVSLTRSLCVR